MKGKILQKFLQTKKHDYQLVENLATATGICCPRLPYTDVKYAFCHVTNCKMQFVNDAESKRLKRIIANNGIVEKDLGHLFITLSSSHFLKKNDFEQYFFKVGVAQGIYLEYILF